MAFLRVNCHMGFSVLKQTDTELFVVHKIRVLKRVVLRHVFSTPSTSMIRYSSKYSKIRTHHFVH
jgi:hypothetical protein